MTFSLGPLVLALGLASDVTVTAARSDRPNTSFYRSLSALDRPSERTNETLRRFDLVRGYRTDVGNTLLKLENKAREGADADLVYALAELSWIEAKRLDHRRKGEALGRYLDTASYAYTFLFTPELPGAVQPSDPRFREACNLYNGALDRLIREAIANPGRFETEATIGLKVQGKEQAVPIVLDPSKTPWSFADVDQLMLASDFEVSGLPRRVYQFGLGVPLIAVRKSDRPGPGSGPEKFLPKEMAFALTAVYEPPPKLGPAAGRGVGQVRLVDPVREREVGAATGPALAIESDLSMPLAYMWSKTDLSKYRWSGLLRPEQSLERAGLMLIRPYEPGKIPVVMVHGLASTPLAWIPMLNDLLRDPRIQQRYQFMLYLYPTGVPFPIAAAGLRETLLEAEKTFNSDGSDLAFARTVLLGHSMGGLLSHATVVDSGDRFWRLNSDQDFKEIIGPADVLDELRRYMFFRPVPFVRRVVFLAVPHRGSDLSRGVVGRFGAGLISDLDHISKLLARLVKDNDGAFDRRKFRRLPSSIETLETNGKMLMALLAMTPAPGVVFHSIIGSERPGPRESTSDGVVSYVSSHFEPVESEVVVRSDHGVQANSLAIGEVSRILLEHIGIKPQGLPAAARPVGD